MTGEGFDQATLIRQCGLAARDVFEAIGAPVAVVVQQGVTVRWEPGSEGETIAWLAAPMDDIDYAAARLGGASESMSVDECDSSSVSPNSPFGI